MSSVLCGILKNYIPTFGSRSENLSCFLKVTGLFEPLGDLIEEKCPCKVKKKKIDEFISPDPKLIPESYPGDIDADLSLTVEAANRDIALALLENEYNNMLEDWLTVNHGFYKTVETVTEDSSAVNAKLTGTVYIHSIDGTMADSRRFNGQPLDPEDYTATIEGSGAE